MKYLVAFLIGLGLLCGVADATYYVFDNYDDCAGWTFGNSTSLLPPEITTIGGYNDAYALKFYDGSSGGTTWARSPREATNFWEFQVISIGTTVPGLKILFLDTNGTNMYGPSVNPVYDTSKYIRITRIDGIYRIYRDEVLISTSSYLPNQPYYVMFYIDGYTSINGQVNVPWLRTASSAAAVVAPSQSANPKSFFLSKNLLDPSVYGLYDNNYNNVYSTVMHVFYGSSTSGQTLQFANCAPVTGSGYSGLATINISPLIATNDYGMKTVSYGGASDTIPYIAGTINTTIAWSQSEYIESSTASITYTIETSYWVPASYDYYINIYREDDLTTPVETYTLSAQLGTQTVASTVMTGGYTYYATLDAVPVGTTTDYMLAFDDTYCESGVAITGTTYNAINGSALSGVTITVTQGATSVTNTSTSTGYYYTSGLVEGILTLVASGLSGWDVYSTSFTPPSTGLYTIDIGLVPNGAATPGPWTPGVGSIGAYTAPNISSTNSTTTFYYNASVNGTSVGGLLFLQPYNTTASAGSVFISNETWNDTTTANPTGWWMIDAIPDGGENHTYNFLASLDGYVAVNASNITIPSMNFTRLDFSLPLNASVTLWARDITSASLLSGNVSFIISKGALSYNATTTSGYHTFSGLEAGVWDVVTTCDGYYPDETEVAVDTTSETETIYMTAITQTTSPYIQNEPHEVLLLFEDSYGNPLDEAYVTVIPTNTTLGSWTWLTDLLGYPQDVYINNSTMSGTTDSMGGITFALVPEIRYMINASTSSGNDSWILFPQDTQYLFHVYTTMETNITPYTTYINKTLTNTTINTTHENLTLQYTDTSGLTTNLSFWVKYQNGTAMYTSYSATPNAADIGKIVTSSSGTSYYYGYTATQTTYGTLTGSKSITYHKLVDLGIMSGYYSWIAAAFLILLAACFSVVSVRFGAVVVPLFAYMFYYFQWMTFSLAGGTLLAILLSIGVFAYIRKQEDRVGG